MLRYGLVALGLYTIVVGLRHGSMAEAIVGVVVIAIGVSLFQAHRVASRWRDEADRGLK